MKDIFNALKFMILATFAGGIFLFGYTVHQAYMDGRLWAPEPPPPAPTPAELELAAQNAQVWMYSKWAFLIAVVLLIFLVIAKHFLVPAMNAMGEFQMAENGQWKPKAVITSSFMDRINPFRENKMALLDPNMMAVPLMEMRSNGHFDVQGSTGGISEQAQLGYSHNVGRSHSIAAMKGGNGGRGGGRGMNSSEAKMASGVYDAERQLKEARLRIAEQRLIRPIPEEPVKALPVLKRVVDVSTGFSKADSTRLPMGYTDEGEVVLWDVEQSPHVRVHGKTQGSGKTNLIKTIVAGALRAGHRVVVLDRRGFKDWKVFEDCVQLIDNRKAGVMAAVAAQAEAIYQIRDAELGAAGVGNLASLAGKHRRIFLIISEFGSACRHQTEDTLGPAVVSLKNMFSESGATGVHVIVEDQTNAGWPKELKSNADAICGFLPEDAAKTGAGGYSRAHDLVPFQFHYEGNKFRTWNMDAHAIKLLASVPPSQESVIDLEVVS